LLVSFNPGLTLLLMGSEFRDDEAGEEAGESDPQSGDPSASPVGWVAEGRAKSLARAKRTAAQKRRRALDKAAKTEDPAERVKLLAEAGIIPPERLTPEAAPSPAPVEVLSAPVVVQVSQDLPQSAQAAGEPTPSEAQGMASDPKPEQVTAPASGSAGEAELTALIEGMSLEDLSGFIVDTVDGNATKLDARLALDEPSRKLITKALAPVLKKNVKPEQWGPEEMLLGALAIAYVPRGAPVLFDWLKSRKAAANG
jgi:hypothetical protein